MSRHSRWPVRVKRGNSTVTIYKADRKKNGHRYREFKLAYYNEIGKRTLQSFNSFKKARKAADNVNVSLMLSDQSAGAVTAGPRVFSFSDKLLGRSRPHPVLESALLLE